MSKLRLLGARLVVAPLKAPRASVAANIVYVDRYYDDRKRFEVLQVGPGQKLRDGRIIPLEIKVGDNVILNDDHETEFEWSDGVKVVRASHVLATWRP